jgi:hypothetical protein
MTVSQTIKNFYKFMRIKIRQKMIVENSQHPVTPSKPALIQPFFPGVPLQTLSNPAPN